MARIRPALAYTSILTGSCLLAIVPARAQEAEPQMLDTITIGASYETEGTGSYTTGQISVGDKDTRAPREVPQSATVLTRERLEDGNFTSLDTAMRKTPGIVVMTNDDGRSSLYSRGFEFDSLYLNGLPTPLSSIYGTQADMATVDHVEILRGPSGLFTGSGEPAGAINMRLKQAQAEPAFRFSGEAGSWNNRRVEADVTGKLNDSGTLRGRFVAAYGDKDSWVDDVTNKSRVLYGTIAADLTPDTTATFSINHRAREMTPFNGLPTAADGKLLDLSHKTFTGADWNHFDNNVTDYIAELEHRFADGGHAKLSVLYSTVDADFLYGYAAGAAVGDTVNGMRYLYRDYAEDALSLDAHISKPLDWADSNVIVGIDHRRDNSTTLNGTGMIPGSFDLRNWNTAVPRPDARFATREEADIHQTGLYGQWRIKPAANWTLIAGGRVSWYEGEVRSTSLSDGSVTTGKVSENGEFTPYLGAIFDIDATTSAYASYTEIFQPQSETDAAGGMLKPRTGRQYELGLKSEVLAGVNASAALFDLKDENRAVGDMDNPGSSLALGKAHMRGLELEASGSPLPGWELTAGYTYTDTDFERTEMASGAEFYSPRNMVQIWSKYRFQQPGWDRLQLGGGIKAFSGFKNVTRRAGTASPIEAPGYAVVDLMASYDLTESVTASLSVNNVFDKDYYERVGGTSVFNFYGEPRSITFKLSAKF
ncbi:TonB-dependent siderophore receptor [Paenirhodobacter sp.]|uniref:TonB-dependent siderophore receptor n=1 Tax=Paenirhodobacter sp. TaxID=1965326 RepID=UPI003B3F7C6D